MKNGKLQIGVIGCGGIAKSEAFPSFSIQKDKCDIVAFVI